MIHITKLYKIEIYGTHSKWLYHEDEVLRTKVHCPKTTKVILSFMLKDHVLEKLTFPFQPATLVYAKIKYLHDLFIGQAKNLTDLVTRLPLLIKYSKQQEINHPKNSRIAELRL